MSKVKIRNIIDRTVILSDSNIRFRREIRPNQVITMDSEKLDEAMSSIGVMNLFKRGFLRIEGEEEVKAELEKLIDFANKFHRVKDCGRIVKETNNDRT